MTVYLPVGHSHCTRARFTVPMSCSDELAFHSCPLIFARRGRMPNLWVGCSSVGLYCVTMTWQRIFKFLPQFTVAGVCRVWLLNGDILAGDAAKQWLLILVSLVVLSCVKISMVKKSIVVKDTQFLWLLPQHGAFSLWCRKCKSFCERPFLLHRQQSEKDKQNIGVAPPGKISADAHARSCTYNSHIMKNEIFLRTLCAFSILV